MEAVQKTMVPSTDFVVDSVMKYNAVGVMTRAMQICSNLQSAFSAGDTNIAMGKIQMKGGLLEIMLA